MAQRKIITAEQLWQTGKRLAALILAFYLAFLLGRSVYHNFRARQRIMQIEEEIQNLKTENRRLSNLVIYYQTETFRELEARSKLGLKKPGEIVIAVPENSDEQPQVSPAPSPPAEQKQTPPNYIKWWEYLFGS